MKYSALSERANRSEAPLSSLNDIRHNFGQQAGMTLSNYLVCLFLLLIEAFASSSEYKERLDLRPLPPSSLLASFAFRSNASLESFKQQHFRYFPRSLGQILQHTRARELHLRFSTGRWDAESWGARPWGGAKEGGTGVELWAWVEADTEQEAFARWISLNHALSGLFCASLNFIDSTRTTRPVMTFEQAGSHINVSSNLHLLHGTLPREVVCTENLTPFLKLLPCKGKAGISTLLDGHKLFDASWQTMAIDVQPICPTDGSECIIQMEQTVDMVLDIERSKRPRENPIPRPVPPNEMVCDPTKQYPTDACYPLSSTSGQSWSLFEIFGRAVKGTCLADDLGGPTPESICIHVPHERKVLTSSGITESKKPNGNTRCYSLPALDHAEIVLPQQHDLVAQSYHLLPPPLYAERSFTGYGQERGGVQTLLTNPSPTSPVSFIYLESLPWFMKPYIHTLQARTLDQHHQPSPSPPIFPSSSNNILIEDIYYRPALDRHRGTQLEIRMSVPPSSTVSLTYDFDKAILRYTEYPPDANRGFDVAPAVIRLLPSSSSPDNENNNNDSSVYHDTLSFSSSPSVYLRTTSLLLPLPTPDFSMPYNVIILTSTVMALAFGSIFNLLIRRFVAADEVEGWDLKRMRDRVIGRVRGRMAVLKERMGGKGDGMEKKVQ